MARAVSSVVRQMFKDFELIVVDDGSAADIRAALAPFTGRLTLLTHKKNRGVSAARNTGIRHGTAPFVAFLDSDDVWLPDKLREQMSFFRQHPDAVACQAQEIWMRQGTRVNPQKKHVKPNGDIFLPSLKRCLVSPSAVMLKRSVLGEIGSFDEHLPACEDYDLWIRLSCRYPVFLIDRPLLVRHGGHPDQLSTRYWGMDRFRIQALVNLIRSGVLNHRQRQGAMAELRRKCDVFAKGCVKRGKMGEGEIYFALPEKLEAGDPLFLAKVSP